MLTSGLILLIIFVISSSENKSGISPQAKKSLIGTKNFSSNIWASVIKNTVLMAFNPVFKYRLANTFYRRAIEKYLSFKINEEILYSELQEIWIKLELQQKQPTKLFSPIWFYYGLTTLIRTLIFQKLLSPKVGIGFHKNTNTVFNSNFLRRYRYIGEYNRILPI